MELRHLRYFTEAAHELHFARAAANLKVTQPALSRQIAALDKELGVELFSRSNKWKIELTPVGEVFLSEAEKILEDAQRAANLARSADTGGYGKLSIGAISSTIGNPAFSAALHEMRVRYPKLVMEVVDATSSGLPEQVRQHTLDIAFLRSLSDLPADDTLIYEHLWNDRLAVAMPAGHPLTRKKKLPVASLAGESFILVPERTSGAMRQYLAQFFHTKGGFSPHADFEIYNTYTALRMVAAGLGVTVVAESYIGTFARQIAYRYFSDASPEVPLLTIRAADNRSRTADIFLDILKNKSRKFSHAGNKSISRIAN